MFQGHVSRVRCLSVCDDYILSGSDDRSAKLWSCQSSSSSSSAVLTLSGHAWPVSQVCLSRQIAVTVDSCSVRVWSLPDGQIMRTISDQPNIVELFLDIRTGFLLMCDFEGSVCCSDVTSKGQEDSDKERKHLKWFRKKTKLTKKCASNLYLGYSTMIHVNYAKEPGSQVDVDMYDFLC